MQTHCLVIVWLLLKFGLASARNEQIPDELRRKIAAKDDQLQEREVKLGVLKALGDPLPRITFVDLRMTTQAPIPRHNSSARSRGPSSAPATEMAYAFWRSWEKGMATRPTHRRPWTPFDTPRRERRVAGGGVRCCCGGAAAVRSFFRAWRGTVCTAQLGGSGGVLLCRHTNWPKIDLSFDTLRGKNSVGSVLTLSFHPFCRQSQEA